ncbi:MAG: hypothetical protein NTU61_00055, partial [Candidatus Altiarchaeota archaeon]|nr:hypothetical protein [Candidatus Altiarchaeota archaeon]
SVSHLWFCMFMCFGLSTASDRLTALKFILGRILGLGFLGLVVGLLGQNLSVSPRTMNILFGLSSIFFGALMLSEKKGVLKEGGRQQMLGLGMGVLRGMTPCAKIVLILPLIIGVNPVDATVMMLVYALSSSVYPVIGFVSADVFKNIFERRRWIRFLGAGMLIALGLYYLVTSWFMLGES